MKTYTITKQNFLNYYFNGGDNDEQEELRINLAEVVIRTLFDGETFNYSIEDTFDECEKSCIPLHLLEEFEKAGYITLEEDYREVGDLEGIFNIELI